MTTEYPERTVLVPLRIPGRLWWLIAGDADALDTSVADLIVERERRRYAPQQEAESDTGDRARGPMRANVLAKRAEGLAPRQIAEALHCTVANVRYHLREADRHAPPSGGHDAAG